MKKIIKKWILRYLLDDNKFSPKKSGDLKGVSFESKQPLGNGKYEYYNCHLTKWLNGEGYQISLENYNEVSKRIEQNNLN